VTTRANNIKRFAAAVGEGNSWILCATRGGVPVLRLSVRAVL